MAITIQIKGLKELNAAFKRSPGVVTDQIQKAISLSIHLINRKAKIEAPVKTGRLRTGIRSRISPFRGIVESTVDYGVYVHGVNIGGQWVGTRPHIIRPVKKKALYWKGARHPVKSVKHPGTKANPFMKRGVEKAEGQVQAIFQKAINNVAKQLAT